MAKAYSAEELAKRTFWLTMVSVSAFIVVVFLYIL